MRSRPPLRRWTLVVGVALWAVVFTPPAVGGGSSGGAGDATADRAARPLPQFIHVRAAQEYEVHIPVTAKPNKRKPRAATAVDVGLYSVVPDSVEGAVFLLMSYHHGGFKDLIKAYPTDGNTCHSHNCADLLPHFWEPYFGGLRCEFTAPDGSVLRGNDSVPARVRAVSALVAPFGVFVGACDMPDDFQALLARGDFSRPPGVRVLRESDPGSGRDHDSSGSGGAAFEPTDGLQCKQMSVAGASLDAAECEAACVKPAAAGTRGCIMWQWALGQGCFHDAGFTPTKCQQAQGWVGGRRRHDAWDAVDTARATRKLLSFGCSMPLFGDGAYANRIPQWLEFQLYNFPDAHFFVYLRGGAGGGDSASAYDPTVLNSIPGVVGGVAVLYPYIQAGVVTVVWLPRDVERMLDDNKDGFQRRDENDFLYRARHLSEWASPSVDYDEYFAPTYALDNYGLRAVHKSASFASVPVGKASAVPWQDAALGTLFYPLDQYLSGVSTSVHAIPLHKWPARIPDQERALYISTDTIARDLTRGRLGKYLIRPLRANVLWTHMPLQAANATAGDLGKGTWSKLVVRNMVFNLLHFRDRDWMPVAQDENKTRPYQLTQAVASIVRERLWDRYTTVPRAGGSEEQS